MRRGDGAEREGERERVAGGAGAGGGRADSPVDRADAVADDAVVGGDTVVAAEVLVADDALVGGDTMFNVEALVADDVIVGGVCWNLHASPHEQRPCSQCRQICGPAW